MNSSTIIPTLERHHDELKQFGIVEIGLFGSWVNGKPRRRSDVDILVEFAPGMTTFDNFMETKFFLEKTFHREIDLVIKSAIKPTLQTRILEDTRYAEIS